MVRLFKKVILFSIFSSVGTTSLMQAGYFESIAGFFKTSYKKTVKPVARFSYNNYLPVSALVGTVVSGSCLMGTKNFLNVAYNALGAVPYGAYKLAEFLGPQKTVGLTLAGLLALGAHHYYTFSSIEKKLIDAKIARDVNNEKFMFLGWQTDLINEFVQKDKDKKIEIKKALEGINFKDCNDKLTEIFNRLENELNLLEDYISFVGQYTDLPVLISENVPFEYSSGSEKALFVIRDLIKKNCPFNLDDAIGECKTHTGSSVCYVSQWRWWNPLGLSFAPCTDKATVVCKELFAAYARVYALQKLVKEVITENEQKNNKKKDDLRKKANVEVNPTWEEINE